MKRAVRSSAIGVAMTLAAAAVLAEESDSFAWSATRALSWDDFAAAAAPDDGAERVAATTASILWSFDFRVRLAGDTCSYTITAIDSAAHFHPGESWVDPAHQTAAILAHEQGHFDIAEVYSRQFLAETRELIGTEGRCSGPSMRRATRESEDAIGEMLGAIYDQTWDAYRASQQRYDGETRHGTDAEAQSRWFNCIASLLEDGSTEGAGRRSHRDPSALAAAPRWPEDRLPECAP